MNFTVNVEVPGPIAQDKDWARRARVGTIMPTLNRGGGIRIVFAGAGIATQSFVHALISEAVRTLGENDLDRLEFNSCSPQVKTAVQTVVTYSLHARELAALAAQSLNGKVQSIDVPQANDLRRVREVVDAAADGPIPTSALAQSLATTLRQVYYRANAARILGFVNVGSGFVFPTEKGLTLVTLEPGKGEEKQFLLAAARASGVVQALYPNLFSRPEPSLARIASRIARITKLSHATASRRAQCLLSWRRQIFTDQLSLFETGATETL